MAILLNTIPTLAPFGEKFVEGEVDADSLDIMLEVSSKNPEEKWKALEDMGIPRYAIAKLEALLNILKKLHNRADVLLDILGY